MFDRGTDHAPLRHSHLTAMSIRRAEIQRWGDDRLQVRAWRGSSTVALVSPLPGQRPVSPKSIRLMAVSLLQRGYDTAVTSALSPQEERSFREGGYVVRERLHLLRHALQELPTVEQPGRLHRAKRGDTPDLLATDNAAFGDFWRLDQAGLHDAIATTATTRVRVAKLEPANDRAKIVGYAVSGRSGATGYLQRLAVHPEHQGTGIGRDLVTDSLRWIRRRGGNRALVNTQEANERALALYVAAGFEPEPHGLAVLECKLVSET